MSNTRTTFAPAHKWDRNFYLLIVALAWLGIIMGFGYGIRADAAHGDLPYPFIINFHALVFVGWLVLFTVQVWLVRIRRLPAHQKLGKAMAWVFGLMVVLGPWTALSIAHRDLVESNTSPMLLIVLFIDILAFAGLTTAGLLCRKVPAAHKRLMLLGTLYITDAGFSRWFSHLSPVLRAWRFSGTFPWWVGFYSGVNLLMIGIGVYDLVTRRRLHPAYIAGMAWVFANEVAATRLVLHSPGWTALATKMVAAGPF
jgi:hypothetical protein